MPAEFPELGLGILVLGKSQPEFMLPEAEYSNPEPLIYGIKILLCKEWLVEYFSKFLHDSSCVQALSCILPP